MAATFRNQPSCKYSPPVLINGSNTPPPSRRFPGTTCYMVTLTVQGKEFHGLGPTPQSAKAAATEQATLGQSNKTVCNPSVDGTCSGKRFYPTLSHSSSMSSLTQPDFLSFDLHSQSSNPVLRPSQAFASQTQPRFCPPPPHHHHSLPTPRHPASPPWPHATGLFPSDHIPNTAGGKLNALTQVKHSDELNGDTVGWSSSQPTNMYTHSDRPTNGIIEELIKTAQQKGLYVSFDITRHWEGSCKIVTVRATAGRWSSRASHAKLDLARKLAAEKLLRIVKALPDTTTQPPSQVWMCT